MSVVGIAAIGLGILAQSMVSQSCPTAQPARPLEVRTPPLVGFKVLDDDRLGKLLIGRVLKDIKREPPNLYDGNYLERFRSDGRWEYEGGRALQTGTYSIRGGLVCVKRDRATGENCRAIWRNARGQYLLTEAVIAGGLEVSRVIVQDDHGSSGEGPPICD